MIPFRKRGMYQAMQNSMFGFGSICGASFGGSIADTIGWRWCFLLQFPISIVALVLGFLVVKNPGSTVDSGLGFRETWRKVDVSGALLLVTGISVQLVGLSLGGNVYTWDSPWVIGSLAASFVLLGLFLVVEARTKAMPMIPLRMLKGRLAIATQICNVCVGLSAYAFLFTLPLFFQVVLLDSATMASARLAVPSVAVPVGAVLSGVVMSRWGKLTTLVRVGAALMAVGNALLTSLSFVDSSWKYFVYIILPSVGQGIVYPGLLFTSLATFDHEGKLGCSCPIATLRRELLTVSRIQITRYRRRRRI